MTNSVLERHFLTVPEVAAQLRISPKTVRRLIERGAIPAVQIGGRGSSIRIDADELDAWLYAPSTYPRMRT